MPLYDYECRNCGHRVEVLHGVNATGPQACEQCGGPMRKLLTPPAIVFKGSGWAKKDRSTASASKKSDGAKPDSTKSDSGASSDSGSTTASEGSTSSTSSTSSADGSTSGSGTSGSSSSSGTSAKSAD